MCVYTYVQLSVFKCVAAMSICINCLLFQNPSYYLLMWLGIRGCPLCLDKKTYQGNSIIHCDPLVMFTCCDAPVSVTGNCKLYDVYLEHLNAVLNFCGNNSAWDFNFL